MTDHDDGAATGAGRWPEPSGLPVGDLPVHGVVTVDLPVPRTALAVGAHPDDCEFGAGGTLAKWAARGCEVHLLVLTDGSKGTWDPEADLDELRRRRQEESRRAAAVLTSPPGAPERNVATVRFLGQVDGELGTGADVRREVVRAIREVRPQVLLGHDPWRRYRLHPDHRAAGFLTVDGLVAARDPHFHPELGIAPHRPDHLLLWEPDEVNHVEDVEGFVDVKGDALRCHASQEETTLGSGVGVLAERLARQTRAHGAVAGRTAGEAFHRIDEL